MESEEKGAILLKLHTAMNIKGHILQYWGNVLARNSAYGVHEDQLLPHMVWLGNRV
jgi:hypothetical protein